MTQTLALDAVGVNSAFLWYLSDAPRGSLAAHLRGGPEPKALGRAGLDVAVTESFRHGTNGRLALHADPNGGDHLVTFYEQKMQMTAFSADARLPYVARAPVERAKAALANVRKGHPTPEMTPRNDGRYYYFTPQGAAAFRLQNESWRTWPPR